MIGDGPGGVCPAFLLETQKREESFRTKGFTLVGESIPSAEVAARLHPSLACRPLTIAMLMATRRAAKLVGAISPGTFPRLIPRRAHFLQTEMC